ncbi:MAB_1171c family putative transporter [Streptomyces sp. MNP-20]|uniref:MAB_1171c family putative transporter n=1 Tax=Streptomyces sp. MNP-20 TaxID=2721165 RepID=UPI001C1E0567|nr:MAB_1171c family putative transporter [Streptomyces sp. MNP-20]
MSSVGYYVCALALTAALVIKIPALIRSWADPLLRCVCALMAVAAAVFFVAAPSTVAAVNDLAGVPNFAAPLMYCLLTAYSAACLTLLAQWRHGPTSRARRVTRSWLASYSLVILALIGLFCLGEAPVERRRDVDTYYITTPFIREMIVLYLLAHTVAMAALGLTCWRWMRHVDGWLRAGLFCLVGNAVFNLAFDAVKFTAIGARWAGRDVDYLSTSVAPPLAAASSVVCAVGYTLPLAGPRLSRAWLDWNQYRRLEPLWQELHTARVHQRPLRSPWWYSPTLKLTHRETVIGDELLKLSPHRVPQVRDAALDQALQREPTREGAEAVADAAAIAAAVRARAESGDSAQHNLDHPVTHLPYRNLVRIADALRSSTLVDAVRRQGLVPVARHGSEGSASRPRVD